MSTVTITTTLAKMTCGRCGGLYAISEDFRNEKHRLGGCWACPYCGSQWSYEGYEKSENATLKRTLAATQAALDQSKAALRDKENELLTANAAKLRLKRRAANGVCPCCTRSFANVKRHIKHKHPEYAESPP